MRCRFKLYNFNTANTWVHSNTKVYYLYWYNKQIIKLNSGLNAWLSLSTFQYLDNIFKLQTQIGNTCIATSPNVPPADVWLTRFTRPVCLPQLFPYSNIHTIHPHPHGSLPIPTLKTASPFSSQRHAGCWKYLPLPRFFIIKVNDNTGFASKLARSKIWQELLRFCWHYLATNC